MSVVFHEFLKSMTNHGLKFGLVLGLIKRINSLNFDVGAKKFRNSHMIIMTKPMFGIFEFSTSICLNVKVSSGLKNKSV